MTRSTDEVRTAGRGVLWIAGAKIWFVVSAYAVHVALPHILASREAFGDFASALNAVSIVNNVLIASTVQTVSKLVSEDEGRAAATIRRALLLQLAVGAGLATVGWTLAPWFAERIQLRAELTPLLRAATVVMFCYALYAALVGALNGRRRFVRQAGLDATFSTLRTAGILGGALWFADGALGAFRGFGLAAAAITLVAILLVGPGRAGPAPAWSRFAAVMAPLWAYQLCLNGLLLADVEVLRPVVTALALEAGHASEAAEAHASAVVGVYAAAQRFAFVPYQLLLAVTFVVFPTVSRAAAAGDAEGLRAAIRGAVRFSAIVLVLLAAPLAGAAPGVMRLVYPDEYAHGASVLAVLAASTVGLALFVVAATVLAGGGRAASAARIAALALIVALLGNAGFVRLAGHDGDPGLACAAGTAIGTWLAAVCAALAVRRAHGAYASVRTLVRVALAALVGFAAARAVPEGGLLPTLGALGAGALAVALVLIVSRELGRADFDLVCRVLGRRN